MDETIVPLQCRHGAALTFKFIIFLINNFVTAIFSLNPFVHFPLCCLYMSAIPIKYVYTNDTLIEYREDIYTTVRRWFINRGQISQCLHDKNKSLSCLTVQYDDISFHYVLIRHWYLSMSLFSIKDMIDKINLCLHLKTYIFGIAGCSVKLMAKFPTSIWWRLSLKRVVRT